MSSIKQRNKRKETMTFKFTDNVHRIAIYSGKKCVSKVLYCEYGQKPAKKVTP